MNQSVQIDVCCSWLPVSLLLQQNTRMRWNLFLLKKLSPFSSFRSCARDASVEFNSHREKDNAQTHKTPFAEGLKHRL